MTTALATLGQEVVVTCTDNLAPITAKDDVVTFDMKTSGDSTATGSQTGYTATAACQVAFGGATRTKSLKAADNLAAAGKFVFWFTPATALQAADTITLTADKDIFTANEAVIACTAKTDGNALALTDADTKKSVGTDKQAMTVKVAGAADAGKVISVTCTTEMANNPAAGDVGFQVKTSRVDTTNTDKVTGYTTINANSGAWAGATPSTLCEGDKPGNLVIKYKPTLLLASTDDLIFVADKAIFAA